MKDKKLTDTTERNLGPIPFFNDDLNDPQKEDIDLSRGKSAANLPAIVMIKTTIGKNGPSHGYRPLGPC